jgi:Xaa-Pro aminopeptidase
MPQRKIAAKTRLASLRAQIKAQGLNGFIIPRMDAYQGEFVSESAERVAWLSGFTGSAGVALVLEDQAAVMTDGRYLIQVTQQVDPELFETGDSTKVSIAEWLTNHAQGGDIIGYDPWLHTPAQIEKIEKDLAGKNIQLKAVKKNPVDEVWEDRPSAPLSPVEIFSEKIAGASTADKRTRIAEELKKENVFAAIITLPDSIAWLLNVRGNDIRNIPVPLSYAFITSSGEVTWFINSKKISLQIRKHLGNMVYIYEPQTLEEHLNYTIQAAKKMGQAIGFDFKRSPVWFKRKLAIAGAQIKDIADPCLMPKALKTAAEQDSIRKTHITDGAALVKFLHWLDTEGIKGTDEMAVAEKLEAFRAQDKNFRGPSFDTIAGFGPHGAIVHYRATEESNTQIKPDGLLLLDSGGQYNGGTTDITRTVPIGKVTQEMKDNFTRVLKGHIAVATARFKPGTTGIEIDALARKSLQEAGRDYAHGTGHGVGCFLSVHEEAASLSPRGKEPVLAGMLISNEPGYYKEGAYGIRTENLVLAQAEGDVLYFETVSLAPIDTRLVIAGMLSPAEADWLNAYHVRVYEELAPLLNEKEKAWLYDRTAAI